MNDDNPPIAQVELPSGLGGARRLLLHPFCLQERSGNSVETVPLTALASVRAGFERDERKIQRGVLLIIAALAVFAVAGPIESLAGDAAADIATRLHADGAARGTTVAGVVFSVLDFVQLLARLLPGPAAALAVWGIWRFVEGILGTTTLTLVFGGAQRDYAARGRNAKLFDFAELIGRGIGRLRP